MHCRIIANASLGPTNSKFFPFIHLLSSVGKYAYLLLYDAFFTVDVARGKQTGLTHCRCKVRQTVDLVYDLGGWMGRSSCLNSCRGGPSCFKLDGKADEFSISEPSLSL